MINYKNEISKLISNSINIAYDKIIGFIEIPNNSSLGDYAFPCFRLAKELKMSPQKIAEQILENMKYDKELIYNVEIVGGYLNFFINKGTLVRETIKDFDKKRENYGSSNIGNGKNIVIDYSSPNIAKPFHIGHLRSTVIGGSLYKIYKFLGYNSVGFNFLGDWGVQFGKVMAGISLWKDEYEFVEGKEIDTILQIYVRFSKEEKENPEMTNLAKSWLRKLEEHDEETYKIWEWIRKISLENFKKTYKLLNSSFDVYHGEAYYNDKMQGIIEELKNKNLLVESEGAQVVNLDEYDMPPCIIITSAGTSIYATRDLASLEDRAKTYDFEKAIYVVGSEQQLHFKQIFKVFELMGYEKYAKNCIHVPFGLVVDKNGKKIGSRTGNSVVLEDIIHEAIDKVKNIILEKNPSIENIDETARKIGVGAIIFNDLNNSRVKDEIFDWDMMLNFNGETGPYIQYMYVRTKSILDKAGYVPNISDINTNKLLDEDSINIIKNIYLFNDIIVEAANKNEPSIISRYVLDIAKNYSVFYNNNRILSDDNDTTSARLYLTYMVNIVIENATKLLGMEMPEKM